MKIYVERDRMLAAIQVERGTIESFRRLAKDEVYPTLPWGWQVNFTKCARNTDISGKHV